MASEGTARRAGGETVTPAEAIAELVQLSADVRSALLLDARGQLAAASDAEHGEAMRAAARELLEHADADDQGDHEVAQVEVTAPDAAVFCVRVRGWTLVALADRDALPSLMFLDMRSVLAKLEDHARGAS